MRLLALCLLALSATGCTSQAVGERCEQNDDCNASANEVCRQELNPSAPCTGAASTSGSCICCPSDPATAASVPACRMAPTTVDSGTPTSDVPTSDVARETAVDSAPLVDRSAEPEAGSPCDFTSECPAPLVCGPRGRCMPQCRVDRDCTGMGVASACVCAVCVPPGTGSPDACPAPANDAGSSRDGGMDATRD